MRDDQPPASSEIPGEDIPDWWPYAAEFPHWHVWRGVCGLVYARRPRTSPPLVVRRTTPWIYSLRSGKQRGDDVTASPHSRPATPNPRIESLTGPSSRLFIEDRCAGQTRGVYGCGRGRTEAKCN